MKRTKPPVKASTATESKPIRAVRTPYGTRVMKTITCRKCGREDQLSFVPKEGAPLLCRSCAERELNVVEESGLMSADRLVACSKCGKEVRVAKRPRKPREGETIVADPFEGLCDTCRFAAQADRRQRAAKPSGVHPLIVKGKKESRHGHN